MIVTNGRGAFPGQKDFIRKDIRVREGIVTQIGDHIEPDSGEKVVDARGWLILPGGIDPHVHFYDPGNTRKEDFAHGTAFAASGGITTIIDMPCTSVPAVSDLSSLNTKLDSIKSKAHIDYAFHGGMSRQIFDKGYRDAMASIADKVCGFKVYAISGMDDLWGALDHWRFRKVAEEAKELGRPVLLHAEDREYVDNATREWRDRGSGPEEWYRSRPELAEVLAVSSALRINRDVGGRLHIVHVGTAEAASLIGREARETGLASGETCPQYLAFGLDDFIAQGPALKIAPSIKKGENREGLWKALGEGYLSFAASDHAPGTPEEKKPGNIWENSAGIAGTGTLLPYLFSEGYMKGRLDLEGFLKVICENGCRRFGLFGRKGSLEKGKDGDMVLINPDEEWTVRGRDFLSKGKLTPFEGRRLKGKIAKTFVRGRLVYDGTAGLCGEPGWGEFLIPSKSRE